MPIPSAISSYAILSMNALVEHAQASLAGGVVPPASDKLATALRYLADAVAAGDVQTPSMNAQIKQARCLAEDIDDRGGC